LAILIIGIYKYAHMKKINKKNSELSRTKEGV
jgi:hypothetical protein